MDFDVGAAFCAASIPAAITKKMAVIATAIPIAALSILAIIDLRDYVW